MNKLISPYLLTAILLAGAATSVGAQEWTLDACMDYALQHQGELRTSKAEMRASSFGEKSAKAALLPEISGIASIDHYWKIPVQVLPGELLGQPPGTFVPVRFGTPWMGNYGMEASLELANPATWQQVKVAALRASMARDGHETMERTLRRNVRMAYQVAALNRLRLSLAQSRATRLREIHALITQQFEKGFLDKIGFNQSRAMLNDLIDMQKTAETGYRSALVDLKFWMGYPLDSMLEVATLPEISVDLVVGEPISVTALPEYGQHRRNADLAHQEWKASRAALLPSLALKAGYNRLGFGASLNEMGRASWFPSGFVGLQLRIPILSIRNMAYVPQQQRALAEAAALELEQYQNRETSRLMQERLALENAITTMRTRKENVELAKENEDLVVQKLEKGVIDMVELKQTQQELDQATDAFIEARLDYLRHRVAIDYLQNKL